MNAGRPPEPRIPLLGRNAAAERLVRERTWMLERRIDELERERADLRRILRSLGEGVLAVDRSGIVVHANPAALAMLGMEADGWRGNHMYVAVPEPGVCELLDEVMRGEQRVSRELVLERPDGDVTLLVSARPLRRAFDDDSDPEGGIVVVRDVSDLRRLERLRQDFFGNVSHELKTPVTAIRGALETIHDDPDMPDAARDRFLDGAMKHVTRLTSLVNDLLALARLEGDPRELSRVDVDVAVLARDVLEHCGDIAARRRVRLLLDVPDAAHAVVHADEEAVRQALTNLVDNAVAHSAEGDAVTVRMNAAHDDSTTLVIDVVDTGTGIPADAVDRVFERFYRVDAARSRARGGTGIGLSIVKHVAQSHGGSVHVVSRIGEGSTFTLRLPVSRPVQRGTTST